MFVRKCVPLLAFFAVFICGCALTELKMPVSMHDVKAFSNPKGNLVYIRSVKDNRLGVGKDLNSKIIGAKTLGGLVTPLQVYLGTDTAGTPGGSILLENHESVVALVRNVLEYSLMKSGYNLIDVNTNDAIIIDAIVNKLWVSAEYGMMMDVFSVIDVDISINNYGETKNFNINSKEKEKFHIATDKRYHQIFTLALEKFENNAIALFRQK